MSSGNLFQARVTDGRKELKYCCDFAGTVWRSDSLRKGCLAVLPTVGGGDKRGEIFCCHSMLHLIIKYKLMFFPSIVRLSEPVSVCSEWRDASFVAPVTMRAASFWIFF